MPSTRGSGEPEYVPYRFGSDASLFGRPPDAAASVRMRWLWDTSEDHSRLQRQNVLASAQQHLAAMAFRSHLRRTGQTQARFCRLADIRPARLSELLNGVIPLTTRDLAVIATYGGKSALPKRSDVADYLRLVNASISAERNVVAAPSPAMRRELRQAQDLMNALADGPLVVVHEPSSADKAEARTTQESFQSAAHRAIEALCRHRGLPMPEEVSVAVTTTGGEGRVAGDMYAGVAALSANVESGWEATLGPLGLDAGWLPLRMADADERGAATSVAVLSLKQTEVSRDAEDAADGPHWEFVSAVLPAARLAAQPS